MIWLSVYAMVGIAFTVGLLIACAIARKDVENGTADKYKREFHHLVERPELKLWLVGFTFFLWPIVVGLYFTAGGSDDDDDKNDPQSRVPPEYR